MLLVMVIPASAVVADPSSTYDYEVEIPDGATSANVMIPDPVEAKNAVAVKFTSPSINPAVSNSITGMTLVGQSMNDLSDAVISYEVPSGANYAVFVINTTGFTPGEIYTLNFGINDGLASNNLKFYVGTPLWKATATMEDGAAAMTFDVTGAPKNTYLQVKGFVPGVASSLTIQSISIPGTNSVTKASGAGTGYDNGGFVLIKLATVNVANVINGTYNIVLEDGNSNTYTLALTLTGGSDPVATHTVTYDVAGGSAAAPTQADVAENDTFIVASYSGTRNGYAFGGWTDGTSTYAAGSTYTMGSSNVTLTAVWNSSAYNFEVIGTANSPNVHIPAGVVPRSGYFAPVTVKYSNDAIDPLSEIVSTQVLINGNSNYSLVYTLNANHPQEAKYVELSVYGTSMLTAPSLLELRVTMSTGSGLETFSVFMPSNGYWLGSIGSDATTEPTLSCIKEEDSVGEFQLGINGISVVDSIISTIPGVSLSFVSDESVSNAGYIILKGTVDWTSVVNGTYAVSVTSGSKVIEFNLVMSKATLVDSTDYDYEFVGVTQYDVGDIEWDLSSKQSLLIKVQLPNMISNVTLDGYCVGTDDELSSVVDIDVKSNSVTGRYVVFELTDKSLTSPVSLVIRLSCGNQGLVGKLAINVMGTASSPQNDGKYELEYVATQVNANTRLTIDITKTASAPSLENAKLLVIAKYQGGIVVNFYSTPSLTEGNGADVIEVSSQNLREVVIEIVDGFQHSTPVFYGYCVYKNVGGN